MSTETKNETKKFIEIDDTDIILTYQYVKHDEVGDEKKHKTTHRYSKNNISKRLYKMLTDDQKKELRDNLNVPQDIDTWKYIKELRVKPKRLEAYIDPVDYGFEFDTESKKWFLIYTYVYVYEDKQTFKRKRTICLDNLSKRLLNKLPPMIKTDVESKSTN